MVDRSYEYQTYKDLSQEMLKLLIQQIIEKYIIYEVNNVDRDEVFIDVKLALLMVQTNKSEKMID